MQLARHSREKGNAGCQRTGRSTADPACLGILSPENDAVYPPLKKGANEVLLAVSEPGGGWSFICRLEDRWKYAHPRWPASGTWHSGWPRRARIIPTATRHGDRWQPGR